MAIYLHLFFCNLLNFCISFDNWPRVFLVKFTLGTFVVVAMLNATFSYYIFNFLMLVENLLILL